VQRKISALGGEKKVILRETRRAVRPWGGLSVFVEFLRRRGFPEQLKQHLPIHLESPKALNPAETFTAFLASLLAAARLCAVHPHTRGDNFFRRCSLRSVLRFTPTRVGTIHLRSCDGGAGTVHPHTRGDNSSSVMRWRSGYGSPPHAWGQCYDQQRTEKLNTVHSGSMPR
jgi:hypothetical protein